MEVSTSSLNDIMFFLLLFFLIVSTLANPNVIRLLLPKAKSTQQLNKQQITISVSGDKKYFINNVEVPFNKLESELLQQTNGINQPTVVIRMAFNLNIQDLVDIIEIGNRNQIKMVLATERKSK